jgi:hypothetical protein
MNSAFVAATSVVRKDLVATEILGYVVAAVSQETCGRRAMTLISKSKPASQFTPTAVQFG